MMKFSDYHWTAADMIGGNPALDFVNTASEWGNDPVDRLGGPAGLGAWAGFAGLLDEEDLKRLRREIADDEDGAKRLFEDALTLRSALYRIFAAAGSGKTAAPADLDILNEWKIRAAGHCEIRQDENGFRRRCADEAPALERAMRLIVEAAEHLLLHGRLDRLRSCGGDHCEWMFHDQSKNGKRRWCSMATCGNEHKVKQFRKRNKAAA